jgi:ParB/RepB/Spo0J family partition protein
MNETVQDEQLSLIPTELRAPKQRKVILEELPLALPGDDPTPSFVESIRNFGLLQPIALIESGQGYKVAFGRRRIKAARQLGWLSIAAWIFPEGMTSAAVLTLIENAHRRDNVTAKLQAIDELRRKVPESEICESLGLTKQEIKQAVFLLDNLVPEMQEALKDGRVKASTAKRAAKLPQPQQRELAQLEKVSAKDVDNCLRVQAVEHIEQLPASLFEDIPQLSWQQQARPLIEQLLALIPEGVDARQYIELVADSLKSKA